MALTVEGTRLTDWNRRQQARIGAVAAAETLDLARLLDPTNIAGTGDAWLEQMLGLQAGLWQASADQAADYLLRFRVAEAGASVAARLPVIEPSFNPVAAAQQTARSLTALQEILTQHGIDPQQAWDMLARQLAGAVQQQTMWPGRQTVYSSAQRSGLPWRRVSDGNPCAFCAMLVTRGPSYRSEATALGVYRSYHPFCGCTAEEWLGDPRDWVPTAQEQRFIDLYDQAHQPGMTGAETAAAMRAQGQGVVNDAHTPQTQTSSAGGSGNNLPPAPSGAGFADDESRLRALLAGEPVTPGLPGEVSRRDLDEWHARSMAEFDSLPKAQQDALRNYTGLSYRPINSGLRAGEISALRAGQIEAMDAAMRPLGQPTILYRAVPNAISDDLLLRGSSFDPAYTSTTMHWPADHFGNTVWQIAVPNDVKGFPINGRSMVIPEEEIILQRGLKFTLQGVTVLPDGTRVLSVTAGL